MKLTDILNNLHAIQVSGNPEGIEIESIELDSRRVNGKSIFVAVKGFKLDGHDFIPGAISQGARVVIVEDDSKVPDELFTVNNCVKILVENSRRALAEASVALYDDPSAKLNLIGVTGTKGKTTTTFFIKKIIEASGKKCGLIGTNKYIVGEKEYNADRTTPEANVINKLLNEMVEEGCEFAVMEVSSHSIDLFRVHGLNFAAAILTNVTSDHLDYHKTFEAYRDAKVNLFSNLQENSNSIINADDKSAVHFISNSKGKVYTYGTASGSNYLMENVEFNLTGTTWNVTVEDEKWNLSTPLIGKFNAFNATAALVATHRLGIKKEDIIKGIGEMPQVPGRFEVLSGENKKVIIDYSHTADSLEKALQSIHHLISPGQKIVTVFGCGGDRDKTKRPEMGKIAEKYSDFVIVTSDNPRTEDPVAILKDIEAGMKKDNHKVIENRTEAIKEAVLNSDENSVVLIAGKGHETYQEINGVKHHFSDKEEALKYLRVMN